MEFLNSYFEDEVREGFYVPAMVKRAWAAELEVLDEIDRICRKYNIKYFADWGTLLGAVRHGGFIPWDDDLDICMKRSDYKKFLQAADKELKGDFKIFTYETHPDFWHFMARVVGKPHICFEKEHLKKFHEFPYITGVDIFVLDYVSSDRAKEEQRDMAARYVIEAADEICTQNLSKEKIDSYLRKIEMLCSVKIPEELKKIDNSFDRNNAVLNVQVSMKQRKHDLRVYLYRLAENLFDLFDEKQSDSLTRMMPNGLYDNNLRFSKEYYDEMLWLPFENTNIPVPFAYDEMLRERYGDYMNIVKNTGGHDYPFFEAQQKQLDKVLESETDIALPKFTFTKELLVRAETVKQNSCKSMAAECQLEFNRLNLKLKDSVSKEDFENVLEILEISQQLAIDLGTMIENCKGEGYRTVQLLQEYCENIFSLYEAVTQGGDIDKNLSNMLTSLEDVGGSIEKDIIKRKEAVFITYKASQWDYISSVWKAAMEDADCDVYVIVVPYYYKDFDGTIRDMQYEAEQYPVDVKITKYDEFNFELHCPDIIFIQNACDNFNSSVTIHTFFYSDNLKKFTDKLVYIPPFEIDEFTKKNYCEYLNMKYYCTVPGVINADKIFVQSENMRDLYIEKLVEFAGEDTRKVWEEKILGFGLPRFDVVKGNSEDYVKLTEEWEQIIQKPDGGRKKVILYSTSVSELLKYGSEVLKKYKRVFETFKENMDDVVLLWHPDSLISLGVSSLDSQIWEEYNNLVEQFKTEHYGIYDDSTDMNYAISISDAYYGNVNSEVWLCKKAGLNIMIDESINLDLESEKIFCSFEELYDDGEYYWFTSWNYNALFRMDRESWSVEYIGSFPDEAPNGFRLYSSILEYNGRLYFTPCRANEIGVYDKEKQKFSKIKFNNDRTGYLDSYAGWNFYRGYENKGCLYFMPHQRTFILKVNLNTEEISFLSDWYTVLRKKGIDVGETLFFGTCRNENIIYAPFNNLNMVMTFDLTDECISLMKVGDAGTGYADVCFDEEKFWLAPLHGKEIISWDNKTNTVIKYPIESIKRIEHMFWGCACFNGDVYFFPNGYDKVLRFKIQNNRNSIGVPEEMITFAGDNESIFNSNYIFCKSDKEHLMTFDKDGYLIEYKQGNLELRKEKLYVRTADLDTVKTVINKQQFENFVSKKNVVHKTNTLSLNDYIQWVINSINDENELCVIKEKTFGSKIYETVNL